MLHFTIFPNLIQWVRGVFPLLAGNNLVFVDCRIMLGYIFSIEMQTSGPVYQTP